MTLYIIILVLIFLGSVLFHPNNSQQGKKTYIVMVFILLCGTAALRKYTVGNDLRGHYYNNFLILHNMPWNEVFRFGGTYEPGFLLFYKIIGLFTDHPQVMIAVHSIITISFFCCFYYKHTDDLPIAIILYVTMNQWFTCLTMLRQILSVCLVLKGTEIILDESKGFRRYISMIFLVFLATMIHYSGFIGLIFIVIYKLKFRVKHLLMSFGVCGILLYSDNLFDKIIDISISFLQSSGVIGNHFSYIENEILGTAKYTMVGWYYFIPFLFIFLLGGIILLQWPFKLLIQGQYILGTRERNKNVILLSNEKREYTNDFLMYSVFCIVVLRALSFRAPIFARFTHYFIPFAYILLSRAFNSVRNRNIKLIGKFIMYGTTTIAFIWMNSDIRLNFILTGAAPYKFFWQ